MNYVVYKGLVFKTYEGKLIQSGIRSKTAGTIQSYEFEFSVENEALARKLMLLGGKNIELHYKEYFGALPWRGFSKFVVDSIVTKPIGSLPIDSETGTITNYSEVAANDSGHFSRNIFFGPTTRIRRQYPCCIVSDTPSLRSRFRRGSTTHSTTPRIRCAN